MADIETGSPHMDSGDASGSELEARRAFLKNCAKYAAAMPPAITLLLSAGQALGQNCSVICDTKPKPNPPCDCTVEGFAAPDFSDSTDLNIEELNQ